MDPRLEAFKSPEFFRVFGAVASLAGAAEEEELDVSAIVPTADFIAMPMCMRRCCRWSSSFLKISLTRG
ncbi:MAG: hypothetical protein P8Y47_09220 [Alphaproteobacteria bacterium]